MLNQGLWEVKIIGLKHTVTKLTQFTETLPRFTHNGLFLPFKDTADIKQKEERKMSPFLLH